ncbi:MFS transporter [Luteipulveratus mongoliensis]|nr:MFS transporter [Luteipulveratus mongoliensis]
MRERLGIPHIARHRTFVTAVAVDAVGSGVFMPVSVLYFLATTSLTLPQVGAALSIAALVSLPFVLFVGQVVDRVGAKRVLIVANAVQAIGFVGYTQASSFAEVVLLTSLVGLGQSAFWASYSPLVAALSEPGERELWFGFLGALRNVGFALGGLAAGLVVTIDTTTAYRAVVLANAASYVVAVVLYLLVRDTAQQRPPEEDRAHWAVALRDKPFRILVLGNLVYALCSMALNIAMPVYASEILELPGWVTGAIFTVNTVLVGFGQGLVVRRMTGHARYRIALLANVVFAAGFVLLAGVSALSTSLAAVAILVAVAVYTLGELLGGPVLTTIAVDSRPAHLRGRYMALYQLSWLVCGIIAPSAFTWLLAHGEMTVWFALIGVAAVGALICMRMPSVLPVAAARVTNRADDAADASTVA